MATKISISVIRMVIMILTIDRFVTMNPIQLPDSDQCKQLDHYGHIELILDMGLDYGFSIFINYDHNDGNKSNTCNYTCINSFTGNFRPIQSKNKSLQICQQTSQELCQHFNESNIFINNVRMIFILNKTFYYFLFNDKSKLICNL